MSWFIAINCTTLTINSSESHPRSYPNKTYCFVRLWKASKQSQQTGSSGVLGIDALKLQPVPGSRGGTQCSCDNTEAASFAKQFENSRGKTQQRNTPTREAAFFRFKGNGFVILFFLIILKVTQHRGKTHINLIFFFPPSKRLSDVQLGRHVTKYLDHARPPRIEK